MATPKLHQSKTLMHCVVKYVAKQLHWAECLRWCSIRWSKLTYAEITDTYNWRNLEISNTIYTLDLQNVNKQRHNVCCFVFGKYKSSFLARSHGNHIKSTEETFNEWRQRAQQPQLIFATCVVFHINREFPFWTVQSVRVAANMLVG